MCEKEDPPSYKDSVSGYVPPPAYSEQEQQQQQQQQGSNDGGAMENGTNADADEDDRVHNVLDTVTDSTEFSTIDDFDFHQLDAVLDNVDLSSDV